MDLLSRNCFPRNELFRLVLEDGKLVLDLTYDNPGRGIYIKKDLDTIEKVFKKKMLQRYTTMDLDLLKEALIQHVE